jgi:hypothetical protein
MIQVDGIILVLSCQKHLNTRLKIFKLPKNNYNGWKVIYVIGDLFIDSNYKMINNLMVIKCEDSYIHLLKKLVLALKYLYEIYDIKEGILRCGDDLLINELILESFLNIKNKFNFFGQSPTHKHMLSTNINLLKITKNDNFMVKYYKSHYEDFYNPYHNLKNVVISRYTKRPALPITPAGVIYYISNKACKILIHHMEKIKYNIFQYDYFSQSYPYTIEDCAVSFILYLNRMIFINNNHFYSDYRNSNVIAWHTNMYKN